MGNFRNFSLAVALSGTSLFMFQTVEAQIYNSATLTIESGLEVTFDGDFINQSGGKVDNLGTINAKGDWTNNGDAEVGKTIVVGGQNVLQGEVIFNGTSTQTMDGTSDFNDVTVDNASGVSVSSGTQGVFGILELETGNLTANNGLTIRSNQAQTGMVDDFSPGFSGTSSGTATVERFMDAPIANLKHYHLIGSAVDNPSITTFSELNLYGPDGGQVLPYPSCLPNEIDPASPYGNMFEWREDANFTYSCDQSGWFVRSTGSLNNLEGYAALAGPGDETIDATGSLNSGTYSLNGLTNSGGIGDGWQLVSNPFPSPIVWNNPSGFDAQAHVYVSTGYYGGSNQPLMPGAIIPHTQAFWTRVSNIGTANFSLSQSDRTRTDVNFYRSTPYWDQIVNFVIEGNGFADKTVIYLNNGPTNGWDAQHDAWKKDSRFDQPTLYTKIDNYPENISINGLPYVDHPTTVPMGLKPGTAGSYEIRAEDLGTFDPSTLIYLEDLKGGVIQNLMVNDKYSFNADPSTDAEERFLVHFVPPAKIAANGKDCDGMNAMVNIDLGLHTIGGAPVIWDTYTVTNTNGDVVATGNQINGVITLPNLPDDEYTLTLEMNGYSTSQEILVESIATVDANFLTPANEAEVGELITFSNLSAGATGYVWDFGDGNTSIDLAPTHGFNVPGTYEVKLTASNDNCSDLHSTTITVLKNGVDVTGIDEEDLNGLIDITSYGALVTIRFEDVKDDNVSMDVFNTLGQRIRETESLATSNNIYQFNLNHIPSGYYFVQLLGENTDVSEKVFISDAR